MASGMTSSEYIAHHLTNLTYGKHPVNGWSFAESGQQVADIPKMNAPAKYSEALAAIFAISNSISIVFLQLSEISSLK